ncbi:MAG: NfeD family protein [Lachnospiraceae bacterium]|jgi:Membrane protein implicated in regulation of membrane protease activity|nr:NfeD family protein [Lachnospiraceae bacterium]
MDGVYWLIIVIVMAVIEIITLGLTTIWFAGGALVAFIASLLGADLAVQIILFIVVSVALMALTRPLAVNYLKRDRVKTNAESLIGKLGVVKEKVDNLNAQGIVSVEGQEWTARAIDDEMIPLYAVVEVVEIRGVKLMVREKVRKTPLGK